MVDLHNGFGSMIQGHAHPAIVRAVRERVAEGTHFAAPTEDGVAVAEELQRRFGLPRCRFVNSGSEATMDAIRHLGGRPANFLEIGGDAYTKAEPGLALVLDNPRVRSLVVNFCGAYARTDVMAAGVVLIAGALPKILYPTRGEGRSAAFTSSAMAARRSATSPSDRCFRPRTSAFFANLPGTLSPTPAICAS